MPDYYRSACADTSCPIDSASAHHSIRFRCSDSNEAAYQHEGDDKMFHNVLLVLKGKAFPLCSYSAGYKRFRLAPTGSSESRVEGPEGTAGS